MRLVDEWRWIWRRAWSVRLIVLAAILSGLEVMLSVMSAYQIILPIGPGTFAAVSGLVTVAALIARFVAQDKSE